MNSMREKHSFFHMNHKHLNNLLSVFDEPAMLSMSIK